MPINYYALHVYNTQVNFYKQTAGNDIGSWYFFQAGRSGTKLGVCRLHTGPTRYCGTSWARAWSRPSGCASHLELPLLFVMDGRA